jgi:hypothetical protein
MLLLPVIFVLLVLLVLVLLLLMAEEVVSLLRWGEHVEGSIIQVVLVST